GWRATGAGCGWRATGAGSGLRATGAGSGWRVTGAGSGWRATGAGSERSGPDSGAPGPNSGPRLGSGCGTSGSAAEGCSGVLDDPPTTAMSFASPLTVKRLNGPYSNV